MLKRVQTSRLRGVSKLAEFQFRTNRNMGSLNYGEGDENWSDFSFSQPEVVDFLFMKVLNDRYIFCPKSPRPCFISHFEATLLCLNSGIITAR